MSFVTGDRDNDPHDDFPQFASETENLDSTRKLVSRLGTRNTGEE